MSYKLAIKTLETNDYIFTLIGDKLTNKYTC